MLTVQVREVHFLICTGDITTTHLPSKDMIEIARRKAPLAGLTIYGKMDPPHEVCPCLLVGNTIPEERFIITGGCNLQEQEGGMPGAIILTVSHAAWP
jgi:hypothetical protein